MIACDCVHEEDGFCHRYPKVLMTVLGKNVWVNPPADHACGERKPRPAVQAKAKPKRKAKGAE